MKNKITNENYEEVMLGLLENEFLEIEREEIIFEIERNPLYQFEWKRFQKCIISEDLKPYEIEEVEFWKSILKKEGEPIVLKINKNFFQWRIAASLLMLIALTYLLLLNREDEESNVRSIVHTAIKTETLGIQGQELLTADVLQYPKQSQHKVKRIRPVKTFSVRVNLEEVATTENKPEKIEEVLPTPDKSQPSLPAKREKYMVKIISENILESDLALMQDFNIMDRTQEEEKRIDAFLKVKETTLAKLLKNTTVRFKKKDNNIYLLAYGDDNSMFVWEIANQ